MEEELEKFEEKSTTSLNNQTRTDAEIEYIILPSQGYFFTGKYKNIKKIKVRKLDWTDEDILTTKSYYDNDTLIEEILQRVIINKNFPINEIVPVDKDTILLWLRIGAFGSQYTIPIKCICEESQKSKKKLEITWNLGDLDMPDYPKKHIEELKKNGYIKVLFKEKKINLVAPALGKLNQIKEFLNDKEKEEEKFSSTIKLLSIIKSIEENNVLIENIEEIYNWLLKSKLKIQDSRYIQKCASEIDLKIKTTQTINCEYCGYEYNVSMLPATKYFFGLNLTNYREYLMRSINFLTFWGRIDYQSVLHMPVGKRRRMIELTHENLKLLYNHK